MSNPRVEMVGGLRVSSNHPGSTPTSPSRVFEIALPIREVDSTIECGFQTEWCVIEDVDGRGPLRLSCGAGFGSGWASLSFDGKRYAISGADFVSAFLGAIGVGDAADH